MDYEININPMEIDKECMDEWGAAFLWLDERRGVEYNLCYDSGICVSAIYMMECGEYLETDHSTFSYYEIDFEDDNWRGKLVEEMERVAKEFWGKEDTE